MAPRGKTTQQTEVLVVGAGGCGLVLSSFLADAGIDFVTVERHAGTSAIDNCNLPQIRLEPIFRQHAAARAPGRVRFSHELLEFSQDATGVTATMRDLSANCTYQVRAHYLVGADAGRMRRSRLATVFSTQNMEFFALDVELGFQYPAGAIVGDGTAAPERDPVGQRYRPTTRPGHRLPHCWLDQRRMRMHAERFLSR